MTQKGGLIGATLRRGQQASSSSSGSEPLAKQSEEF